MRKRKALLIFSSILLVIAFVVTSFVLINKYQKQQAINASYSDLYQKRYNLTYNEVMKIYKQSKDWNATDKKLLEMKYFFSPEKLQDLYSQGYPQADIAKAQFYSTRCKSTPDEILKLRGAPGKKKVAWKTIEKKFAIDAKSDLKILGITNSDKEKLRKFNLPQQQLIKIGLVKKLGKLSIDDILVLLEQGKTVDQIFVENNK